MQEKRTGEGWRCSRAATIGVTALDGGGGRLELDATVQRDGCRRWCRARGHGLELEVHFRTSPAFREGATSDTHCCVLTCHLMLYCRSLVVLVA